jgi:hypothetical protein
VHVQEFDAGVAQQLADALAEPLAFEHGRVGHHRLAVVGADRQLTPRHLLGDGARDGVEALAPLGVDEHRPVAGVGAAEGERVIRREDEVIADLGVAEAAAAGRGPVGAPAPRGACAGVDLARRQWLDDECAHAGETAQPAVV